jgi:mannose-6-phosphate isomerase-like protein (cupin superfamily)
MDEVVRVWEDYFKTISNWKVLIEGIEPKDGGCGLVYELPNPIDRPNESFAIADMTNLEISEPHMHANGETEIYFVIQGVGRIAVGDEITELAPGVTIVTPPETTHVTLPGEGLVLAVVNTPPFELDNYVSQSETEPQVAQAIALLRAA